MSTPNRTPEAPAKEALFREIPDTLLEESITGPGTVDTISLGDVENGGTPGNGTSVLGRWVWVTPKGGDAYVRRYDLAGSAPLTASMVKGRLWADGVTEEVWIDSATRSGLAVEGSAAMTLVFEFPSGS